MKNKACFLMAAGVLAMLVIGNLPGRQPTEPVGGAAGQGQGKVQLKTAADMAAIKKAGQSFLNAYLAGDARAMAAHWDGQRRVCRRRRHDAPRPQVEIEKSYEELFAKQKTAHRGDDRGDLDPLPVEGLGHRGGLFPCARGEAADLGATLRCCTSAKG